MTPRDSVRCPGAVIAVDGLSGTGKSSVASALRDGLGASALEFGPMYRYVAWLWRTRDLRGPRAAAARLLERVERDDLTFDLRESGRFAASALYHHGRQIDEELWDRALDEHLSVASSDHVVRTFVFEAALRVAAECELLVVVGREASRFARRPQDLDVFLEADYAVRLDRKRLQLRDQLPEIEGRWDAGCRSSYRLEVDTTDHPAGATAAILLYAAHCHLDSTAHGDSEASPHVVWGGSEILSPSVAGIHAGVVFAATPSA